MHASATISGLLLEWYASHGRALPWRVPPGAAETPDPYRVWLSEVMLQQTTVAAVKPYFAAFMARWPDVEALAAADEADVLAAWAGLGYYSRARNLVKCARAVAAMGGFPESEEDLRRLPGLGPYTAAAVAAIAFGRRAVVVDANVERVVARLFALDQPMPAGRARIRALADAITPQRDAGDFAQAMMDLGATVCTARAPRCSLCPLAGRCAAGKEGAALRFPARQGKKSPGPERAGTAYWIEREGRVWLVRRAARGMLGGMRALPDDGWSARTDGSGKPPVAGIWREAGRIRHVFTHFRLTLRLERLERAGNGDPPGGGEWWPVARLDEAGLPAVFAKAAGLVARRQDDAG